MLGFCFYKSWHAVRTRIILDSGPISDTTEKKSGNYAVSPSFLTSPSVKICGCSSAAETVEHEKHIYRQSRAL